jgi:glycosyltransferase involved in cell wall biosynthesis
VRFLQSIQTTQPEPRWHWLVQRLVQRAAEKLVVPSRSVARVAHHRARVPPARIAVIPNAVDARRFVRATIDPMPPTTRVGYLGRLDPVKRIPDLLEAIRMLPCTTLRIFGDGPDRARVREAVGRLGLESRVTLHGAVASPEPALSSIGMLVLPSEAEGFGLVLIEAMAAGIPVVATAAPGIRDVVQNEQTGLLVPVAAPGELAAAIRRIIDDAALRERLVENGRAEVLRHFNWDAVLAQYRAVLNLPG